MVGILLGKSGDLELRWPGDSQRESGRIRAIRSAKKNKNFFPDVQATRANRLNQRNTPWGAPACADCPGFLVLGAAPAPASTSVPEPQIVVLG